MASILDALTQELTGGANRPVASRVFPSPQGNPMFQGVKQEINPMALMEGMNEPRPYSSLLDQHPEIADQMLNIGMRAGQPGRGDLVGGGGSGFARGALQLLRAVGGGINGYAQNNFQYNPLMRDYVNTFGQSRAELDKLKMAERAQAFEEYTKNLELQLRAKVALQSMMTDAEQGYNANTSGNRNVFQNRLDAQMAPFSAYPDYTAGLQNEAETETINTMRPHKVAESVANVNQSNASAGSLNASRDRTIQGKAFDAEDQIEDMKGKRLENQYLEPNLQARNKKGAAEAKMAEEESLLPIGKRKPGNRRSPQESFDASDASARGRSAGELKEKIAAIDSLLEEPVETSILGREEPIVVGDEEYTRDELKRKRAVLQRQVEALGGSSESKSDSESTKKESWKDYQ